MTTPTTETGIVEKVARVKLVRQEQPFGCTAACLAMILGCTYSEAASRLASDTSIFDTQGGGYHVMESQLVNHGFAVSRKWRIFQPGNQQRAAWPCPPFADLHWCEVIAGPRGGHAVVMLKDGIVLDPMSDEPKRLSDYAEVNFVAAVIPIAAIPDSTQLLQKVARALDDARVCLKANGYGEHTVVIHDIDTVLAQFRAREQRS